MQVEDIRIQNVFLLGTEWTSGFYSHVEHEGRKHLARWALRFIFWVEQDTTWLAAVQKRFH